MINLGKDKIKFVFLVLAIFILSFVAGINLSVSLVLVSLCVFLKYKGLTSKNYNLLHLGLLFLIIFTATYFIIKGGLSIFYIPFSLIPMLTALLFNNLGISLLITLAIAISGASLSAQHPFQIAILFLISGTLSAIMVNGARRRNTVIRAGLVVGLIQVATLVFLDRFWFGQPLRYLILFLNGFFCSIIVLGILPIFEYLFKTVTNISLLELGDFHHPLLERLVLEAPGTFHHSLVVGNLSETACRSIGANALLARIGAYYHDIGKLSKPEYFSENQDISKHDNLTPSMSKLIIMNHIKEGLELANKYKLKPALVDFIQQHHGNSLVYYFYRRALEGSEDDQAIKEDGFRYPGPKPDTKEAAIVLLADSVEAATRALKNPSPAKIEEVVHKVVNNKFIDGQLDECDLTLKDLEKISVVFVRILSGIYHSRVTYPEEQRSERSENNHKKFPKENPRRSEKDKKDNS